VTGDSNIHTVRRGVGVLYSSRGYCDTEHTAYSTASQYTVGWMTRFRTILREFERVTVVVVGSCVMKLSNFQSRIHNYLNPRLTNMRCLFVSPLSSEPNIASAISRSDSLQ